MQIQVRDANGIPIPRVNIRISQHDKNSDDASFDVFTDLSGNTGWPLPYWPEIDYTLWVNMDNVNVLPEYEAVKVPLPLTWGSASHGEDHNAVIILPRKAGSVSRLHVDRTCFKNESGKVVFIKGATFFPAYEIFLNSGPDSLRPALQELKELGCNAIRIFGMSHYIQVNEFGRGQFNPANYGNRYFDELAAFFALAESYGMYVYWSAFPDRDLIGSVKNDQDAVNHWNRLIDALAPIPNVLIEVTNEGDAHGFNYVNPFMLRFPEFCPACAGSYGEDSDAYRSGQFPNEASWGNNRSFGDIHPTRRYPAEILDSTAVNNVFWKNNRALMVGEPDRFGSNGNADSDSARLTALAGMVGCAGIFFHSTNGKRCEAFDSTTRVCAEAFFGALRNSN